MFMASPEIFTAFPEGPVVDFSKEVLPAFQGRMHGFRIDGFNLDIGTHDNYRNADQLAKELEYSK
jgi:NDP-sugar pyrophosphorylase family protein